MGNIKEEPPPGAPDWIVTFADMISLLVTFFVMLMSFTTMDESQEMVISSAFSNAGAGVVQNDDGHTAVTPPERDHMAATHPLRGADQPHSRPDEELSENLAEMGQKSSTEHLELDLSQIVDGLQIHFGRSASFAPGSVEVNPELAAQLGELGRILQHYQHLVLIEGFTDTEFKPTPEYPNAEALAGARARAAAQSMLASSELSPELLQIAGLGAKRPAASNETAGGRTDNRRIEVRVISLKRGRTTRRPGGGR